MRIIGARFCSVRLSFQKVRVGPLDSVPFTKPVLNRLWIYMVDRTGVIRNIE